MKQSWNLLGRMLFWLTWPASWLYLSIGRRTRVLVIHDNKVLVVKSWLSSGNWALPGGGQHRNESSSMAAQRELREETGIEINETDFTKLHSGVGSIDGMKYKYDLLLVRLENLPQTKTQSWEISSVQWMSRSDILASQASLSLLTMLDQWSE